MKTETLVDDLDRENLVEMASHLTTLADDEHLVVDNARAMEAWVRAGERGRDDARRRMEALLQVYRTLKRLKKLPMDRPEDLTRRAATIYAYLDIPADEPESRGEPVDLLPAGVDATGETFYIEAVREP